MGRKRKKIVYDIRTEQGKIRNDIDKLVSAVSCFFGLSGRVMSIDHYNTLHDLIFSMYNLTKPNRKKEE